MKENDGAPLKEGETASKYSVIINMILVVMKGFTGYLSGNIALIADAIHSFADVFSSAAVFIGLKLSQRKPDELFPYGYHRIETLVSLLVSVLIIITGLEITWNSIIYILNPASEVSMATASLAVSLISIGVSYAIAFYKVRVGRRIGSTALLNDGKHSYVDVVSSILVFLGIFGEYMGLHGFQGIAGVIISVVIIYIGIRLAKYDVLTLLDACIDRDSMEVIKKTVLSVPGVEGVHEVRIRRSGPYLFGELHIELERGLPVDKIEGIISQINSRVKEVVPSIDHLTVQPETVKREEVVVAVPLADNHGMESTISTHFGRADSFLIARTRNGEILDYRIVENPGKSLKTKRGIRAAELLKNENIDVLVIEKLSEGPELLFSDYLLGTVPPEGSSLEEVIKNASMKFSG
ncbi:cation transporter [Methanothermobacter thermautotrophicus]|uniref:Cation transporter n=1 Tax=Methanothermobacter thermautotrophicus TaxID=145262 RepID=A0A842YLI6_METTF|nr:cation diffusion facilitator family transporter [Methanothermobacter thermautotrophicus]MBE2900226.1 cation transporter [Methanothermobacter thermautotrophicus]MCQ8905802.1 cation diffusion facilitator family transporter [Methanothermobacter sp.]